MDVRDAAGEVAGLARDETAALVFGPETSGLMNAEIALCGRAAFIPSHPAQPSYNLSHAVAIAAYEVHRASRRAPPGARRRATHGEKEALLALLRSGLLAVGALPPVNTDGYFEDWRALVQRVDLTPKEKKLLEHLARKLARAPREA
jgi:tRNA C32,U32 (ribose-2'-O)-methylase TrmJ